MGQSTIVKIQSTGADAKGVIRPVTIEVEVTDGIGIHLIGLSDATAKETLLRTVTALQASGFHIPGKKIIINITPNTMYRRGSNYDLPIAIGMLQASGQIKVDEDLLARCVFSGELGLDGSIRQGEPYQGYAMAMSTFSLIGQRPFCFVTSIETAIEASPITNVLSYGFGDLPKVLRVLQREEDGTANLVWFTNTYNHFVTEGVDLIETQTEFPL